MKAVVSRSSLNRRLRFSRRLTSLVAGLLMFGPVVAADSDIRASPLWTKVSDRCPEDALRAQASECIVVKVRSELLESAREVSLSLPDGTAIEVRRQRISRVEKSSVWHGVVKDKPLSRVTFAFARSVTIGTIVYGAKMYRLRSISTGEQVIEQIKPSSLSVTLGLPQPQSRALMVNIDEPSCYDGQSYACATPPEACWTDSPHWIDVMVLYTDEARKAAGDDEIDDDMQMDLWIATNIEETNLSYESSGAAQRIRLAHSQLVPYKESGSVSDDRKTLLLQCDVQSDPDQELDEAHELRDQFKADTVVLITHLIGQLGTVGQANTLQADQLGNYFFEPCAFAVVQVALFTTPELKFAHELGHLMGAQHEIGSAFGPGAIPQSSFGFFDKSGDAESATCGPPWMTIMTERSGCDECEDDDNCSIVCQRVPYWSNSDLSQCGKPLGSATANNSATLNRTALTVANFRCNSPVPGNVWMKDGWDDTGSEPDANLAGLSVSDSPYIWIRNSPDTSSMFTAQQHLHENPVAGQQNFVYVKIHNSGGATASGILQLFSGIASSAVSWQGSFTEIGSLDVSLASKSTRIVEIPWPSPDAGKYCLIARWESESDPMATQETTDIEGNVRGNNNLVWRNVVVVDSATQTVEAGEGAGLLTICS